MPYGDGVDEIESISRVPEPTADRLNQRQIVDYRGYRDDLIKWMYHLGKNPQKGKGYALSTVSRRACNIDQFFRFMWDEEGRYTSKPTVEHADGWMQQIAMEGTSDSDKSNKQKAIKMLLRYHDIDDWDPEITYSGNGRQSPPDFLTKPERSLIGEAALEFGTVPSPRHLDKDEREEWKNFLAMRFNKPATEVTDADFDRANGMKYPSIVYASLDAALRPAEVGRARVSWVDLDNGVLRIPHDEDTKGEDGDRDNWVVALRDETVRYLDQWIAERELYEKYDDTDRLWLTRRGNPYTWRGLKHILQKMCEIVDIETSNRKMTWYAIRHSTGTYFSENSSLEAARVQLRRQTLPEKYDNTPVDERKETLNGLG